jgi:hypothetical protein
MFSNSGSNRKSLNFGCNGKTFGFKIMTNRPIVLLRLILITLVSTAFICFSAYACIAQPPRRMSAAGSGLGIIRIFFQAAPPDEPE